MHYGDYRACISVNNEDGVRGIAGLWNAAEREFPGIDLSSEGTDKDPHGLTNVEGPNPKIVKQIEAWFMRQMR